MMGIYVERAVVAKDRSYTVVLRDRHQRKRIAGYRFTMKGCRKRVAEIIEESQKWSSLAAMYGEQNVAPDLSNVIPFAKRKPKALPRGGGVGEDPHTG